MQSSNHHFVAFSLNCIDRRIKEEFILESMEVFLLDLLVVSLPHLQYTVYQFIFPQWVTTVAVFILTPDFSATLIQQTE